MFKCTENIRDPVVFLKKSSIPHMQHGFVRLWLRLSEETAVTALYHRVIYCLSPAEVTSRVRGGECMPTPQLLHLRHLGTGQAASSCSSWVAMQGNLHHSGRRHQSWSPRALRHPHGDSTAHALIAEAFFPTPPSHGGMETGLALLVLLQS